MARKFLGRTVQFCTTSRCNMECPHCSSRLQEMPDMDLTTFTRAVKSVKENGASRVELFANDPLLHPDIEKQVGILNESGVDYAILTVGASPNYSSVRERFLRVMRLVDREKGAFVFSVDYTKETAEKILVQAESGEHASYAFKANTFWKLAPLLRAEQIPVRINVVISRHNVDEVPMIIRQAAEMGFATSVCFVQSRQQEFDELSRNGLTSKLESGFRLYLRASDLLREFELNRIVGETREIMERNELEKGGLFNAFRGSDRSEGEIPIERLMQLRQEILEIKAGLGSDKVLPGKDFIREIGNRGFGCIQLLQQCQFPQMKVGAKGQMIFCCDLQDPFTGKYSIDRMYDYEIRGAFLEMIRINPYIWTCLYFNSCSFSVNYVDYNVSTAKV